MRLFLVFTALAVVVSAGVMAAPATAGLFDSAWDEALEARDKCNNAVRAEPRYQGILAKIVVGREAPTFAQLSDDTVPTEEEAGLLQTFTTASEPCRAIYRKAVERDHPWMLNSVDRFYFQQDVVMIELVKRRITWGNANRLRRESRLSYEQAWDAYDKARSDAERRAIADSLDKIGDTIRNQPPPPGSGRVTCRWLGPTLICD